MKLFQKASRDEDDASAAKMFKDPRLVYTGKFEDGVSISTLNKVWADGGNERVGNRKLCQILSRQEGNKAYSGALIMEYGSRHRGIRGWQFREEKVVLNSLYPLVF